MSTSGRKNLAQIRQGPLDHRQHNEAQAFEEIILREKGVHCSVGIKPDKLIIYATAYPDFILARSVVSKRSGLVIVQG